MLKVLKTSYLNLDSRIHDPNFINLAKIEEDKVNFTKDTRFLSNEVKTLLNNTPIRKFNDAIYISKYKNRWYLLADLDMEAYKKGNIKAHELTLPDTIQGMVSNQHYYNSEAAPILLIHENKINFEQLIESLEVSYNYVSDEIIIHVLTGLEALKVIEIMNKNKVYYIADGHHRIYTKSLTNDSSTIFSAFVSSSDIVINSITRKIPQITDDRFENAINFLDEKGMLLNKKCVVKKGVIRITRNNKDFFIKLIDLDADAFWNNDVYRFNTQVLSQAFGIYNSASLEYVEQDYFPEKDAAYIHIHPMKMEEFIFISKNNSILPPKSTCFQYKFPSFKVIKKIE